MKKLFDIKVILILIACISVLLSIFKLLGIISWSWRAVASPILIVVAVGLALLLWIVIAMKSIM